MYRRVRPAQVQLKEGQQLCVVCSDVANGIHFGAITCEGCKKFFRRGLVENKSYVCKDGLNCVINPRTRNKCRYCRYRTCLRAGMSREAIQMGRPSKAFADRLTSERLQRPLNSKPPSVKTDSEPQSYALHIDTDNANSANTYAGSALDWQGIISILESECPTGSTISVMDGSGAMAWNGDGGVARHGEVGGGKWFLEEMSDGYASADQFSPSTCSDASSYRSRVMSASSQDLQPFGRRWTMDDQSGGLSHRRPRSGTFTLGAGHSVNSDSFISGSSSSCSLRGRMSSASMHGLHTSTSFTLPAPLAHSSSTLTANCAPLEGPSASQAVELFADHVSFSAGSALTANQSCSVEFSSPVFQGLGPVVLSNDAVSCSTADTAPLSHYNHPSGTCGFSAMSSDAPSSSTASMEVGSLPDSTDDYYRNFTNYENSVLNLLDSIMTSLAGDGDCKPQFESSNCYDAIQTYIPAPIASCIPDLNVKQESDNVYAVADFINVHENAQQSCSSGNGPSASSAIGLVSSSGASDVDKHSQSAVSRTSPCSVSDLQLQISACSSYWLSVDLPDENAMFGDKHLAVLNVIMPAYNRFVQLGDYINRQLADKYDSWVTASSCQEATELAKWIQDEVVPVYTVASVTYFKSLPGFTGFDAADQGTLVRLGQSSSRILVAALNWFDVEQKNFEHFLAWRQDDDFKQKLISFAERVNKLELDSVEAALLNVITIIATDYPGLCNPQLIENSRNEILNTFRAYTTVKFGNPNNRLEMLFQHIPEVRKLGMLRHNIRSKPPQHLSPCPTTSTDAMRCH